MVNATGGNFSSLLGELGGFYRDIKVAEASNNGAMGYNYRPESIPDQTSVGMMPMVGGMPAANQSGRVTVLGLEMDGRILLVGALLIGGIAIVRAVR